MNTLSFFINRLADLQARICSAALLLLGLAMTVIILLQVFFRFVVYVPFPWSEECARFMMIWLAMFGSVVALRKGRHIGVRVLVERLPNGGYDRFIVPFVQLTMLVFFGTLAVQGWNLAIFNREQLSTAMEISMLIPYMAIPAGAAMMMLDIVADMLQDRFPTEAGSDAPIAAASLDTGSIPPSNISRSQKDLS